MASKPSIARGSVQLGPKAKRGSAVLTQVREDPAIIAALASEAERAGITSTEAIRQLIDNYLANPWYFKPRAASDAKTGIWSAIKMPDMVIRDFTAHAERGGVSVAEAVRQVVRRYLDESEGKQGSGGAGRA